MSAPASTTAAFLRDLDPARLTEEVIDDGNRWVDLDAAASVLEESRKSVLAKLILDCVENSLAGGAKRPISATQAEYHALADESYKTHIELMVEARKAANRARVRYDLNRKKLDLLQTAHATLRQEMRMAGVGN